MCSNVIRMGEMMANKAWNEGGGGGGGGGGAKQQQQQRLDCAFTFLLL